MDKTSRRSLLAGLSLAPVALAPAIPAALNEDARLFELKREFDRIEAERDQVEDDAAEAFAEWDRRLEIARETRDMSIMKDIPGHDEAVSRIHDLDQEQDRNVAKMLAHGAKTVAGLAVIATVLKTFDLKSFWYETDEDADWDHLQARRFIDMVIVFGTGGADV